MQNLPSARRRAAAKPNAREVALRALLAGGGQAALEAALASDELHARDRALLTQLVYGTVKMQRALDWSLKRYLRRPFDKLSPQLHWTLRLGAYQLLYMDRIPAHSAVDESVKLARATGHRGTASVANAVLRKVSRFRLRPPRPNPEDSLDAFADYASLPDWLARHLIERFGFTLALRIAEGFNAMPRRAARVNTRILSVDEAIASLERLGVEVQPSRYNIADCIVFKKTPASASDALNRLIRSGRLTMQSEESQLAVAVLDPKPGETIVDVCAGRGVKTGAIAQRNPQRLMALDDDSRKLAALAQDMVRLRTNSVETLTADATKPFFDQVPAADAVLVDAPCSGIGTIGRRAELRWTKSDTDPARLAQTQRAILNQAAQTVKPGGRLLYVSCSTAAVEDEQVIDEFLKINAGWQASRLEFDAPEGSLLRIGNSVLTVPGVDGTDGFFYARLQRLT